MKLHLLDVDAYIEKNKLKCVTNTSIFSPSGFTFDPNGRWSEEIFGRAGSTERKNTFGYIKLNSPIINPTVYDLIITTSPTLRSMILNKSKFIIEDGVLLESESGGSGIAFFVDNIKNIDFELNCKKQKMDVAAFLNANKSKLKLNNFLVLPAGIRDLSLSRSASKQFSSEINDMYEKLITINSQLTITIVDIMDELLIYVQKIALQIYKWLQNNVKGKQGVFRGTMLKKTLDYSARIIAVSDPDIPLGTIGIPWHTIITLYEPYFFNIVLKKDAMLRELIKQHLAIPETEILSFNNLKTFSAKVTADPDNIPTELKLLLISCAKQITEGKDILCKRDPVVDRARYYAASIQVSESGRAATVNSLSVSPQGLDFDGDQLALFPIFTKQALEEAKKMNPAKSKSAWMNPLNSNSHHYTLTLDSIATIYLATLE